MLRATSTLCAFLLCLPTTPIANITAQAALAKTSATPMTQKDCDSEAAAMRTYLTEHGVDEQRITVDETAYTTVGNAQAADKIVPAGGAIVTSPEHLSRALATFNQYAPYRQWIGVSSSS